MNAQSKSESLFITQQIQKQTLSMKSSEVYHTIDIKYVGVITKVSTWPIGSEMPYTVGIQCICGATSEQLSLTHLRILSVKLAPLAMISDKSHFLVHFSFVWFWMYYWNEDKVNEHSSDVKRNYWRSSEGMAYSAWEWTAWAVLCWLVPTQNRTFLSSIYNQLISLTS